MRIVFMGTPDIGVPTLNALAAGPHDVVGVFCQPDKVKGRGQKLSMPPIKETAIAYGIPVFQPETLRDEEVCTLLAELRPDVIVVIAYGKILPKEILDLPVFGCINLHASILPAYRGAAPIQYAVMNGDAETGITVMQMNEGMDTGDILHIERIPIATDETAGTLFDKLADAGGHIVNDVLARLESGGLQVVPQDEALATYTAKITKETAVLHWSDSAVRIERLIRAMEPAPGATTYIDGKHVKIRAASVYPSDGPASVGAAGAVPAGTVVGFGEGCPVVATGNGYLRLTEIQPESKKRTDGASYVRGYRLAVGSMCHETDSRTD